MEGPKSTRKISNSRRQRTMEIGKDGFRLSSPSATISEKTTKKYHAVRKIRFEKHYLLLTVDGKDHRIDLRRYSKKLAAADERKKMNFEVSPLGYGIHWPDPDEDLSINGMIKAAKVRKAS